jgi:hypothetical protein
MQLLNNHSYPNFTLAGGIQINPTVVCGPLPTPVVIPQDARLLPFAVHQGGEVLIIPGGVQWDSESAQTVVTAAMSSCLVWDDLAQVTIQGITAQVIRLEPLRNSQRFGVWSDRGWAPYLPRTSGHSRRSKSVRVGLLALTFGCSQRCSASCSVKSCSCILPKEPRWSTSMTLRGSGFYSLA